MWPAKQSYNSCTLAGNLGKRHVLIKENKTPFLISWLIFSVHPTEIVWFQ
jgi:hypothetical protein